MQTPSRPRHRVSCGRKAQYQTEAEAQAALDAGWPGGIPLTLEVYECTACGGWHHGRRSGAWAYEAMLLTWCRRHNVDTQGVA